MTTQIDCLGKKSPVLRVSTHIYGVSKEIDGKNIHFLHKPRHVTPQINRLRSSPVLRVSTHIYGVSKKINGKIHFAFRHLTSKQSSTSRCSEGFNTHVWVSKKIDGKTCIL